MRTGLIEPAVGAGPAGRHPRGGCLAPVVFAVLLLAGLMIFYAVFWEPMWGTLAAMRWTSVPCAVVSSRLEIVRPSSKDAPADGTEESDVGGKRYVPEVRYAYRHNGTLYHSTRIWFIRPIFNTLHEAEAILARYPKGKETVCYVDPDRVGFAILERGFKPDLLISLVPLGLALVGLIGLAAELGPAIMPARLLARLQRRWASATEAQRHHRGRRRVYAPGGPYSFRPHHSSKAMPFLFLGAIAWNGLMVFLVREVIDSWRVGIPGCYGWMLTLFAIPLVLAGVAMLIPPVYWVIKLFNPRPTLTLSAVAVELGGEISVEWRIRGNAGRIRRLRVFVEGREEATYTRGADTFTDYEVFAMLALADTSKAGEIGSGVARLRMPGSTVPTFRGEHNGIVWVLRIHGQTGPWPDVDEEFELRVVPAGTTAAVVAG